jgi:hypothetical protein
MIKLASDLTALEHLYQRFLESLDKLRQGTDSRSTLELDVPPVLFPDSAFFTPFIIRFAELASPQRAMSLIDDMKRYDIAPCIDTWNFIQKVYFRHENVIAVKWVLDWLRQNGPPVWGFMKKQSPLRNRIGPTRLGDARPLMPLGVMYTRVVKLLAKRGDIESAKALMQDCLDHGYKIGSLPMLEKSLKKTQIVRDRQDGAVRDADPAQS